MGLVPAILAWLKKEGHVIKAAPMAFLSVCLVAAALIYLCESRYYNEKLKNCHDDVEHNKNLADYNKSLADYWKDKAEHPLAGNSSPTPAPIPVSPAPNTSSAVTLPKVPGTPHSPPIHPTPTVGNGIAIGGDNNAPATVNFGAFPRIISPEQEQLLKNELGAPLTSFSGIECVMGDSEGCSLAERLRRILNSSGYAIKEVRQAVFVSQPIGVFIAISPSDVNNLPSGAKQIFKDLEDAGLHVEWTKSPDQPTGKFGLLIGVKPQ